MRKAKWYNKAVIFQGEASTTFIQNDDFTVEKVLFCYYKKVCAPYSLPMNGRPNHGLTLILSGEMEAVYEDESVPLSKGDVFLQRKGDVYRLELRSPEAEYIVTSYTCRPDETVDRLLLGGRVFRHDHSMRYADAFGRAADVYFYSGCCSKPLLRAMVQEIICNILRDNEIDTIGEIKNPAMAAKYYIDEYSNRFLSIDDIAAAAECSPSHMRFLFKKTFGETPNRYLNRVRIERAKEMLCSGLFSIEEIATACGFRNVYYFSRVFKEFTGVPPGRY